MVSAFGAWLLQHCCIGTSSLTTGLIILVSNVLVCVSSTAISFFFKRRNTPQWARAYWLSRIHDHTYWHTTLGMTPLDEWSARSRDLSLTTRYIHERQASMPPEGFKSTILAREHPQTYALEEGSLGAAHINMHIFKSPSKWNIIYDVLCIRYYIRASVGF